MMLRGVNRQIIFEDEEDAIRFLQVLNKYRQKSECKIYAYCLMGNHVHILNKGGERKAGDDDETKRLKDSEAVKIIKDICNISHCTNLQKFYIDEKG